MKANIVSFGKGFLLTVVTLGVYLIIRIWKRHAFACQSLNFIKCDACGRYFDADMQSRTCPHNYKSLKKKGK